LGLGKISALTVQDPVLNYCGEIRNTDFITIEVEPTLLSFLSPDDKKMIEVLFL